MAHSNCAINFISTRREAVPGAMAAALVRNLFPASLASPPRSGKPSPSMDAFLARQSATRVGNYADHITVILNY